mgnify:CR=1 FL=1
MIELIVKSTEVLTGGPLIAIINFKDAELLTFEEEEKADETPLDADSFFNLPDASDDDDEDSTRPRRSASAVRSPRRRATGERYTDGDVERAASAAARGCGARHWRSRSPARAWWRFRHWR